MRVLAPRLLPVLFSLLAGAGASATATAAPESLVDAPYPGTLTLDVDLSDAGRKIYKVHETIPVKPGTVRLHYPKWIPGEHGPTGPIDGVTGMKLSANGQRLAWRRDLEEMYAIQVEVPAGASSLTLDFEFLSPVDSGNFGAGVSATPRMAILEWNQVLFYPSGHPTARITIAPSIKVPTGWTIATALEQNGSGGGSTRFKPLSVTELIDSPLMTGRHARRIDLAPGATPSVHLNIVADRPDNLDLSPLQIQHHQALVKQAVALFGAQHYDHYDFLLALSKDTNHFGLEHHQSSDDRANADFFTSPTGYLAGPSLLPHEYVHSWNGKFRRPAGLVTPTFGEPMKGDLLWVYEGMTNYLGEVLAARSGMWTAEQYRDMLAITAAAMDHRPGRAWRPLRDTADQAQVLYGVGNAWANYRRGVDFYPEGSLLWLDVDTRIRQLSAGARSLDDYIRIFYGKDPAFAQSSHDVKPYTVDEVVSTLNAVQPYDWAAFLKERTESVAERAPLDGITRGGWKLAYTATPTEMFKAIQKENKQLDLMYSLGLIVASERDHGKEPGDVIDVLWNSPAFEAGLAPGLKIIAIDGETFDPDLFEVALKQAQKDKAPIELLVQNASYYSTLRIQYTSGPRYPHLERADGTPDLLTPVVTAR